MNYVVALFGIMGKVLTIEETLPKVLCIRKYIYIFFLFITRSNECESHEIFYFVKCDYFDVDIMKIH